MMASCSHIWVSVAPAVLYAGILSMMVRYARCSLVIGWVVVLVVVVLVLVVVVGVVLIWSIVSSVAAMMVVVARMVIIIMLSVLFIGVLC